MERTRYLDERQMQAALGPTGSIMGLRSFEPRQ